VSAIVTRGTLRQGCLSPGGTHASESRYARVGTAAVRRCTLVDTVGARQPLPSIDINCIIAATSSPLRRSSIAVPSQNSKVHLYWSSSPPPHHISKYARAWCSLRGPARIPVPADLEIRILSEREILHRRPQPKSPTSISPTTRASSNGLGKLSASRTKSPRNRSVLAADRSLGSKADL